MPRSSPPRVKKPRISSAAQLQRVNPAWGAYYNKNAAYRKKFQSMLERMDWRDHLEWETIPDTWQELLTSFDDVECSLQFTTVAGVKTSSDVSAPMVYPMATYGWDGGNAINSDTLNLVVLSTSDLCGGPRANLVMRKDQSYPGVAVHKVDRQFVVQLF